MREPAAQATQPVKRPRPRIAKGPPRPRYFDSPDLDRFMVMFVAFISEHLALRDRLETHELLLERDGKLSRGSIEAFRPSPEEEDLREVERLASMRRIFRVLRDEFDGGTAARRKKPAAPARPSGKRRKGARR